MCCGYLKYKAKSGKNTGPDIIIDKDRVLNWYLLGFNIFHAVEYSIHNLYSEILSPYVVSCARALLFTFALSLTHTLSTSLPLSTSFLQFLSHRRFRAFNRTHQKSYETIVERITCTFLIYIVHFFLFRIEKWNILEIFIGWLFLPRHQ